MNDNIMSQFCQKNIWKWGDPSETMKQQYYMKITNSV
jgi:hypothetical protein